MWGLIMLLFMVAQLPGLIPHKLWASPHESTTTNHPALRLRDLSSLEKGLPCLDKKRVSATRRARTWDDFHTGSSSRVPPQLRFDFRASRITQTTHGPRQHPPIGSNTGLNLDSSITGSLQGQCPF